MSKPQITVRVSPSLMRQLNSYISRTSVSKTDVIVSALAKYLGCDEMPLPQKVAELEQRVSVLESEVNSLKKKT